MADWLDINQLLDSYQRTLTTRATLGKSASNFNPNPGQEFNARNLFLNTDIKWKDSPAELTARTNRGGPSVLSRIFDILSRPRYAVSEAFRQGIQPDAPNEQGDAYHDFTDALSGAWQGFSGKRKTSWSDVIAEQEYNMRPEQFVKPENVEDYKKLDPNYQGPNKLSNTAIEGFGLAGDILFDPINFIGAGTIKSGINAGRRAIGKAPKPNALEGIRPGASITTNTYVRPTPPPPAPSLIPNNQQLPPGLARDPNSPAIPNLNDLSQIDDPIDLAFRITDAARVRGSRYPYLRDTNLSIFDEELVPKLINLYRTEEGIDADAILREALGSTSQASRSANLPPVPGLADTSILSPATRIGNQAENFPRVNIPEGPAPGTNKEIRDLIKSIAKDAGVKTPVGVGKMNKAQLTKTLKDLRESEGKGIISKLTQTEPKPPPAPKISVTGAQRKIAKKAEAEEAVKLAAKYQKDVLSKPNKFPTPGRNPAVNNPAQQVNFFNNKILPAARALYPQRSKVGQQSAALAMLKVAEDAFEAQGMHPAFWSGVPFKLSDVIDRMGGVRKMGKEHLTRIMTALGNQDPTAISDPKIRRVVEDLISEQKLKEAPYVDLALNRSLKQADVAEDVMSKPRFDQFKESIKAGQKAELKQPKQLYNLSPNVPIYVTPKTANTANQTLQQIFKNQVPLTQKAVNSKSKAIQQYIRSNGTSFWAPVNSAITNAIHQTIGGPSPRQLGQVVGNDNKATQWLLSRFSTAYGNKDLRPEVLITQQTARAKATIRAKVLNNVAKEYNADEITEAFRAAQGGLIASSERIDDLAEEFTRSLENLFDANGLNKHVDSVAYRTGMLMKDINKQLRHMGAGFKFTNGKNVDDLMGGTRDFSQGNDWLKSWEVANVDDPLVFMSKIQAAVENVVARNSFLDDFAARWGARHYDARQGFTAKIDNPRFNGYYYPPELASQMGTVLKNWDQFYDPKSDLVRFFDQATSMWKTGMTIYMPAHHIRNLIGDVYLSWMAGVNTMKPYRVASKVIWSQRKRYNDLQDIGTLVSPRAISAALTRPGDNVLKTKAGVDVTAEQIYTAAFNTGLLQSANVVEDIISEVIPRIKPFGGKVSQAARGVAEGRDHYARLAHFIDIVSKSKNKNLEQVFNEAAKTVRKYHPDGMDLTDFERKYLRRLAPFYSWTRKSIPLLIETAVLNPGKTMVYPKFMYGLQQMAGTEGTSIGDPFPEDQLFPEWLKEKGIGPIGAHGMSGIPGAIAGMSRHGIGFEGQKEGYTVANPSNPFIDLVAQFGGMGRVQDPVGGIGQMINPAFRVPAEIMTGHTALGVPIDYDFDKYLQENVPIAAYAPQLANVAFMGTTERGEKEGIPNWEGVVNFLTALGLRGTGAYQKQAEFEARERAKNGGE